MSRPVIFVDLDETLIASRPLAHRPSEPRDVHPFVTTKVVAGYAYDVQVNPIATLLLDMLRPHADLHILTVAASEYAHAALHATGLAPYFSAVHACFDTAPAWAELQGRPFVLIDDAGALSTARKMAWMLGFTPSLLADIPEGMRVYLHYRYIVTLAAPFTWDSLPGTTLLAAGHRALQRIGVTT